MCQRQTMKMAMWMMGKYNLLLTTKKGLKFITGRGLHQFQCTWSNQLSMHCVCFRKGDCGMQGETMARVNEILTTISSSFYHIVLILILYAATRASQQEGVNNRKNKKEGKVNENNVVIRLIAGFLMLFSTNKSKRVCGVCERLASKKTMEITI